MKGLSPDAGRGADAGVKPRRRPRPSRGRYGAQTRGLRGAEGFG